MPDQVPSSATTVDAPAAAPDAVSIRQADADAALIELGRWLIELGYRFVTPTPATHARVNARPASTEAHSVSDVFGWSRPFVPSVLPPAALALLERADALERRGGLLASRVRFSTLGDNLYVHSAFPTHQADAVFFGPDTYRFAAFIEDALGRVTMTKRGHIADVGCGTGAGGIVASQCAAAECRLTLADISPAALRFARINAVLAGVDADFRQCDLFAGIDGKIDLVVANPPYLVDLQGRLYRDGGGALGGALSVRIVREAIPRLAEGGALLLYTGSCIVAGNDVLRAEIEACVREARMGDADVRLSYREIDPDVFGEELELPGYEAVDRIAVVGAVIRRGRRGGQVAASAAV